MAAIGSGALVLGVAVAQTGDGDRDVYSNLGVFARVLQLVRQDYVDEGKVGLQSLMRSALRGMLSSLDPHSQYLDPGEYTRVQDDTQSRFSGVGIVVSANDGRLVVVSVLDGSPAHRAGVLAGDHLMKIGDQLTERMSAGAAGALLRGETGKPAKLTLYRASSRDVLEVELLKETIPVKTVKDVCVIGAEHSPDAKVGYVRITQFNTTTVEELGKALDDLEKQGVQALILDVRHNPGGVLNVAVDIAGFFLPPNSVVVSTEGRVASQNRSYRTSADAKPRTNLPMAILINTGSASASEILAGALKDLRRAILVGETTFGKGSVQSVIPLQDGSAVRLTTAKYYTPGKQVIHEKGIEPTIRSASTPELERLLSMKRREEILDEKEKREVASFKDGQLERAVDALRAVVLYAARSDGAVSAPVTK